MKQSGARATELSREISCDDTIRMLISAVFTVVCLTKLDEMMSGDSLYPVVRPLIASSLLYSVYRSIQVGRAPEVIA